MVQTVLSIKELISAKHGVGDNPVFITAQLNTHAKQPRREEQIFLLQESPKESITKAECAGVTSSLDL